MFEYLVERGAGAESDTTNDLQLVRQDQAMIDAMLVVEFRCSIFHRKCSKVLLDFVTLDQYIQTP